MRASASQKKQQKLYFLDFQLVWFWSTLKSVIKIFLLQTKPEKQKKTNWLPLCTLG